MPMRDYISKVNDRNLQRKRESGLTTYALYSLGLVTLYQIVERYPNIPFKADFWATVEVLAFSFNIFFFALTLFIVGGEVTNRRSPTRLIFRHSDKTSFIEWFCIMPLIAAPFICNLATFIYRRPERNEGYAYTLLMLLVFGVFVIAAFGSEIHNRKEIGLYRVLADTGQTTFPTLGASVASIVVIGISFGLLYRLHTPVPKLQVFVFGILLAALPLVASYVIELKKQDAFTKALEDLEYEIHLRNLDDDEIRTRLQGNYMGFLLPEWIKVKLAEIEAFKVELDGSKATIEERDRELRAIDKEKYPIEFKGRYDGIQQLKGAGIERTSHFFRNLDSDIRAVVNEGRLTPDEIQEMISFGKSISDSLDSCLAKFSTSDEVDNMDGVG